MPNITLAQTITPATSSRDAVLFVVGRREVQDVTSVLVRADELDVGGGDVNGGDGHQSGGRSVEKTVTMMAGTSPDSTRDTFQQGR